MIGALIAVGASQLQEQHSIHKIHNEDKTGDGDLGEYYIWRKK